MENNENPLLREMRLKAEAVTPPPPPLPSVTVPPPPPPKPKPLSIGYVSRNDGSMTHFSTIAKR